MTVSFKPALLLALLCLASASALAARTTVPFDQGWRFQEGDPPAATAATFDDSAWTPVTTPHAFPPITGDRRGTYRGLAWYRKSFAAPADWQGQRVFLRFDAVAISSQVFLNGELLGEHHGGFAAFTYELTGKLHPGVDNQLSVRVDNQLSQDVSPIETSLLYGGIYRHVSLLVTGPVNITPMDFASPGVFLTQKSITSDKAAVDIKTEVNNGAADAHALAVRVTVLDAQSAPVATATVQGQAPPSHTSFIVQTVTIPHPHFWNGVADPYLYTVRVDLFDGGRLIDTVTQPLGLRTFTFDAKRGFILNGVPRQIHGACLHQDWGGLGWAVGPEQEKIDLDILREMGADGIRLVHYQHSQSALDLYDRTGMLIWSELAQFRLIGTSKAYSENVRQQLVEMIRQNYNHPSIVTWSLFNELASSVKLQAVPVVADLNALAHKEDPSRPTVGASHGDMRDNMRDTVSIPDLNANNNYPGWYWGRPEDMASEIVKWEGIFPGRPLSISEYGGGAKITDHKQGITGGDLKPYSTFQPEEWQASVHEGNYRAIKAHSELWGSFIWLAFDTGGTPRPDGSIEGGNIKGIVTQDRKVKKDAYFFYQANWAAKPMAYITSRRQTLRIEANTPVKVYSNASAVTLTVNGISYGTVKPDDMHVALWKKVPLAPGENHVEVTTPEGPQDQAIWTYKP